MCVTDCHVFLVCLENAEDQREVETAEHNKRAAEQLLGVLTDPV